MRKHGAFLIAGVLAVSGALACSTAQKKDRDPNASPYEVEPPNEKAAIAEILGLVHEAYEDKYKEGAHAYRMAHAKTHGCLKARFEVLSTVPEDLRKGLFLEAGQSYETWIRFSNGAPEVEWDKAQATRGMAIKIMGVKGSKLLPEALNDEPDSQDFLLSNYPSFSVRDVEAVAKIFRTQTDQKAPLGQRAQDFWSAVKKPDDKMRADFKKTLGLPANKPKSLLAQPFFSVLPSSIVGLPVKFKAQPCARNAIWSNPAEGMQPDFLRLRLVHRLEEDDACFDFKVQRFVNDEKTPVEDGTAIWPEDPAKGGSPYVTVARIVIPAQDFDTYERKEFCENLAFSPWHSLVEHQPLGGLNRLRKQVYLESSRYRHQWNQTDSTPKPFSSVK